MFGWYKKWKAERALNEYVALAQSQISAMRTQRALGLISPEAYVAWEDKFLRIVRIKSSRFQ